MKIAQLFILILAFLVIKPASAGLLIEPVLGYSFGKLDGDSDSSSYKGPSLGGRLGYQKLGFQLGLDYLKSTANVDDSSYKEDLKVDEFAGFVGFEFPVLLRVYAGYIFSATGNSKIRTDLGLGAGEQDYNLKLTDGTGTKFGIGFTGLPFVDINFEYRTGKFDGGKIGGVKLDEGTDYSAYMIGVSLPFVL